MRPTELDRDVGEIITLGPDKIKAISGKDWKGDFLIIESPGKNT